MKKILSLFLAALFTFASISMTAPAVSAAKVADSVITAETVTAQPGDTIAVNLTIENNPGILGMTLKITYDESKVTLTGVANGTTLSYMTFTTPKNLASGCQLPWDAMDVPADGVKDGVIATLTFQVSEDAAENEEIEIGVSYDAGAIIDNDLNPLTIGMVNGKICIGDNAGGDTPEESTEEPTEEPTEVPGGSTVDAVITADTVTAKPGDTVAVNLTIQTNPGILGMTLKITYDESKATLTEVANGDTLSYMTFTTPKNLASGCQLPWDAEVVPADKVKDGVIATLTFQVSENVVENEEIAIGVSYDAGAIIDNDLNPLTIGIEKGYITVDSEVEKPVVYECQLKAIEVSMEAEVVLRLKTIIPDEVINDDNAYAIMDKDGTETVISMPELREAGMDKSGRYILEVGIASGEMTKVVTMTIYDGQGRACMISDYVSGAVATSVSRTVLDYAELALTKGTAAQKSIVTALLTYGGYAQSYFKKDVGNPAYNLLTKLGQKIPDVSGISADTITQELTKSDTQIGITQTSQQAYLESAVFHRVYYVLDSGYSIDQFDFVLTYTEAGVEKTKAVEAVYEEAKNRYYIDILDIPAAYWDYMYKITATNVETGEIYEVSTSVLAYLKLGLAKSSNETQKMLFRAMYYYNQAANSFFGK